MYVLCIESAFIKFLPINVTNKVVLIHYFNEMESTNGVTVERDGSVPIHGKIVCQLTEQNTMKISFEGLPYVLGMEWQTKGEITATIDYCISFPSNNIFITLTYDNQPNKDSYERGNEIQILLASKDLKGKNWNFPFTAFNFRNHELSFANYWVRTHDILPTPPPPPMIDPYEACYESGIDEPYSISPENSDEDIPLITNTEVVNTTNDWDVN